MVPTAVIERALTRLKLPPEWLREGPDGFRAKDDIDIVFGFAHPNTNRIGCCSDAELVELAAPPALDGRPGLCARREMLALLP